MRKIVVILLVLLLLDSCAISRKNSNSSDFAVAPDYGLSKSITSGNISKCSFFIERADIEYNSRGEVQNFMATIKYELPDKYLISIRSKAGFEAARIFITKDTVLINDRINQILYYGGVNVLSAKYGFEYSLIPVIFGDIIFPESDVMNNINCDGDVRNLATFIKGKKVLYRLDCKTNRLFKTIVQGNIQGSQISIDFTKYIKSDFGLHPSVISLKYPEKESNIKIRIKRVLYDYEGTIEFIPGAKYERRELL